MTAGADAAPAFAQPALKAGGVFAAVVGAGFEFFDFTVYAASNWRGVLDALGLISGGAITQHFLVGMTSNAIRTLHLPASFAMLGALTLGLPSASERSLAEP